MKKVARDLCVVMASLFLFSLTAIPALAGINFGVKGGFTLANIKSVPDTFEGYKWETKMGLAGGVFFELGLAKGFSIQPEVLYVQKGAKISTTVGELTETLKLNLDYVEIPLLLKYSFVPGGTIIPSIYAGPFVGFNTTAKYTYKVEGSPEETLEDVQEYVENPEFGVAFGFSLTQKLGKMNLTLDARYDLGISDIAEEAEASIKTKTWLFMVGISF